MKNKVTLKQFLLENKILYKFELNHKQYLKTNPRNKELNNNKLNSINNQYALIYSFNWAASPEGHNYWSDINIQYMK